MDSEKRTLIELLSLADDSYSHRDLMEELVSQGIASASASQLLLEALTSGILLEYGDDQLYLSPGIRQGW